MVAILNRQRRHPVRTARIKRLLEALLRGHRLGRVEVCLTLVGPDRMRSLNRRFRKIDRPTDVLSFPLSGRRPRGSGHLGDIVVAPHVAARHARELGHGLERELEFLTVHGFLHLLGYDHSPRMEREERRALGGRRTGAARR
jgi:probable rRNA maturation factor